MTAERLTVTEVAELLGCRYQVARDLMLTRKLGEITKNENGKKTVERAKVLEYDRARKSRV